MNTPKSKRPGLTDVDRLFLEQIREDVMAQVQAKVRKVLEENNFTLDSEKTYIEPQVFAVEPLAHTDQSLALLKELSQAQGTTEITERLSDLKNEFSSIDPQAVLRGNSASLSPQEIAAKGAGSFAVQEFTADQIEFLHQLRLCHVFKHWLACLFTPGNQIRQRFTTAACQPWGPVLFWVQESRKWTEELGRGTAETIWLVLIYSAMGTRMYTLEWDSQSKQLVSSLTDYSHEKAPSPYDVRNPKMVYYPDEKLEFFSDSGLPLHPLFFDKRKPESDAFSWAPTILNNAEAWDRLRFQVIPRMDHLVDQLEAAANGSGLRALAAVMTKNKELLKNPEFFLELVLNLAALPREEGLAYMDGLGGMVSGLLNQVFR